MDHANSLISTRRLLKTIFVAVPIIAGLDKFTNILTHWDKYLSLSIAAILPVSPAVLFAIVGIVEIAAGLMVLRFTKLGAYVVMTWLIGVSLMLVGAGFYDVAVRDLVIAASAYVLAQLAEINVRIA